MNLVSIRIITENINELIKFYQQITELSLVQYTPDFAELQTENATLAIGSTRTLQFFGSEELLKSKLSGGSIIEFMVEDVEKTYERLVDYLQPFIIQQPTIMPWGNKSLLFRDPDGNFVNLFTPVTPEAIQKFNKKN